MKESILMRHIKDYLQYCENMGKLLWTRLNAGDIYYNYFCKKEMKTKKHKINLVKKGFPDILIVLPKGKIIFLEVKKEKGKQTEEQREVEEKLKKLGHDYVLIKSIADFQSMLNYYDIDIS